MLFLPSDNDFAGKDQVRAAPCQPCRVPACLLLGRRVRPGQAKRDGPSAGPDGAGLMQAAIACMFTLARDPSVYPLLKPGRARVGVLMLTVSSCPPPLPPAGDYHAGDPGSDEGLVRLEKLLRPDATKDSSGPAMRR